MSQYRTFASNGDEVLYGHDHAIGFFLDRYTVSPDGNTDHDEAPVEERCTLFDALNARGLHQRLEELGCIIPASHTQALLFDCTI